MKGYVLDFGLVDNGREFSGISDQVLRQLEKNTIVLQMFSQKTPSISIGFDDTKAPNFDEGVAYYRSQGYQVGIRGAGGRSVANDEGILNLSLQLKTDMDSHEQYVFFHKFMQDALAPLGIKLDLGIVEGAYCPGIYDISIEGRKVSGTASRAVRGNALVGGFLAVTGDQKRRSEVISRFYEITDDVIRVNPEKMITVSEAVGREVSVDEVRDLVIKQFKKIAEDVEPYDISKIDKKDIEASINRMNTYNRNHLK
jgi:octanoyl-[GcvH]:protein N-octanoyltransferase